MRWYNKPITWKGYGIMCLGALSVTVLSAAAMLLKPDIFLTPWGRLADKIYDKFDW